VVVLAPCGGALDPGNSSPLVAWLASDQSSLVNGQVIRAILDQIIWMHGWREAAVASSGNKRWDATKLDSVKTVELFGTGVAPLRFR